MGVGRSEASAGVRRDRPRVVVVGGGFAGLRAVRTLRGAPVSVTLVDRSTYHLFQPLLYQVATGILSEGQIAPPLRQVFRRQRNVDIELAEVTGLDLVGRTVAIRYAAGRTGQLPYDFLIVGAGAGQSYFGHDEFAAFAPGMKTLEDAIGLRHRIFGAFELAESEPDPEERARLLTFAVVGAGPTGVELAGQIRELATRALRGNFRHMDPAVARVLLFDGVEAPLPNFGVHLSGRATRSLKALGVELHMRTLVTGVDADGIEVRSSSGEQTRHACRTVIWAAGVSASPLASVLAEAAGLAVDRQGRLAVEPDCSVPGHSEVFVVGDMMRLGDLPGMAEVAMQAGRHAARTILRRLEGLDPEPLRYRDLGSMATIARFRAIASFAGLRFSGFVGWALWLFVHLFFLTGFKNRVLTVIRWFFAFVGRGRDERTLTVDEIRRP
jgi:NADH:ubiquinone reductase (H+-translocating)